jgi:outer membrane biosynthesis protein TonB
MRRVGFRKVAACAAVFACVAALGFLSSVAFAGAPSAATTGPDPDPPPTLPNPDPPPPPPPPPAPPPPPPPSYVPPPPPPPPAYIPPPPPPPPPAQKPVVRHRIHKAKRKAVVTPTRTTPKPPSKPKPAADAKKVAFATTAGAPTNDGASGLLVALLVAGLGLAALALLVSAAPLHLLPRDAALLLDENRQTLVIGGVTCIAGLGIGLLIALAGS